MAKEKITEAQTKAQLTRALRDQSRHPDDALPPGESLQPSGEEEESRIAEKLGVRAP